MPTDVIFLDTSAAAALPFVQTSLRFQILTSAEALLTLVTPAQRATLLLGESLPLSEARALTRALLEIDPELAVFSQNELCVEANTLPASLKDATNALRRSVSHRLLVLDNRRLRAAAGKADDLESRLPGRSAAMIELRQNLRTIAASAADVLILGPSGSGKEVVARALHDSSARAGKPFVAINCAALPEALIESELFGHEVGAFAGALRTRFGKFEHARGGTILLDEVGQMPLALQAKLLRVLQERVISRLGSNEVIPLDVRFIATSKTELGGATPFHEDLYWRLSSVVLTMPSLSQRREDIPPLFLALLREAAARHSRELPEVSSGMLKDLIERDWPGNVRELRNAAERMVLGLGSPTPLHASRRSLAERMAEFERDLIATAISSHEGRLKAVYEELGISRKTLYDKMQRYGLTKTAPPQNG